MRSSWPWKSHMIAISQLTKTGFILQQANPQTPIQPKKTYLCQWKNQISDPVSKTCQRPGKKGPKSSWNPCKVRSQHILITWLANHASSGWRDAPSDWGLECRWYWRTGLWQLPRASGIVSTSVPQLNSSECTETNPHSQRANKTSTYIPKPGEIWQDREEE